MNRPYRPFTDPSSSLAEGLDEERVQMVSFLGGTAFITLGLLLRRNTISIPAFLAGAALLVRALKNGNPFSSLMQHTDDGLPRSQHVSVPRQSGIHIARAITINRSVEDLYAFWHEPKNLARVLKYVSSVESSDEAHAHWTIKLPGGATAEYDAERYTDTPNEVISWRSLEGAKIPNAWSVRFNPAPEQRGTEVHLTIEFTPPAGPLGRAMLSLFKEAPDQYFQQVLREFKQVMETGEKATTQGQPSGRNEEKVS
jgi:uncharacterized membrane protein